MRRWLNNVPTTTQVPETDALALERHIAVGEGLLSELPAKPLRCAEQRCIAEAVHHSNRDARARFMRLHADWVYDKLTAGKTTRPKLAELVYAAAEEFPGLVPTRETIERERQSLQADKEAYEIDQGIFFSEVLAVPACGMHLVENMLRPGARAGELIDAFRREGRLELKTLVIERREFAAHVTVHNASCLNAEDEQLIEDMETAVDLVLLDDAVHVCVLRGGHMTHPKYAGRRVFSAGINLKHLHRGQISYVDFLLQRELGYINKILRGVLVDDTDIDRPRNIVKPWIAAVDTFAIGGGAQLLLVCDKVIGDSDSFFSLPAAQEGIVPGVANLRLINAVGTRVSKQIILGGRKVFANEPDGRLLFDEVVPSSQLDEAVEQSIVHFNSPAVVANKRMLTLAEEPADRFRTYMAEFALEQAHRMYSRDVLEKVSRA